MSLTFYRCGIHRRCGVHKRCGARGRCGVYVCAVLHTAAVVHAGAVVCPSAVVHAGTVVHTGAVVCIGAAVYTGAVVHAGAVLHTGDVVQIATCLLLMRVLGPSWTSPHADGAKRDVTGPLPPPLPWGRPSWLRISSDGRRCLDPFTRAALVSRTGSRRSMGSARAPWRRKPAV
eukprot:474621-Pyramimonas_sp.AAC.1